MDSGCLSGYEYCHVVLIHLDSDIKQHGAAPSPDGCNETSGVRAAAVFKKIIAVVEIGKDCLRSSIYRTNWATTNLAEFDYSLLPVGWLPPGPLSLDSPSVRFLNKCCRLTAVVMDPQILEIESLDFPIMEPIDLSIGDSLGFSTIGSIADESLGFSAIGSILNNLPPPVPL